MFPALACCPRCSRRVPRPHENHDGAAAQLAANPKGEKASPGCAGGHKRLSPLIFPLEEPPSTDASQDKPPLHRREWKSPQQLPLTQPWGSPPCPHRPQLPPALTSARRS